MLYAPTIARGLKKEFREPSGVPDHEKLLHLCRQERVQKFLQRTRTVLVALIEHAESVLDDPHEAQHVLGLPKPMKVRKGGVGAVALTLAEIKKDRRGWSDLDGYAALIQAHEANGHGNGELHLPYALDPGLSDIGRRQAASLQPFTSVIRKDLDARIPPPDYSSHLARPMQTADDAGLHVDNTRTWQELGERIMEPQHGLTGDEIRRWYPDIARALKEGTEIIGPGVEPLDHFRHRTESGILRIAQEIEGTPAIAAVVTHQTLIKYILHRLLSPRSRPSSMFDIEVPNASVTLAAVRRVSRAKRNVLPPSVTDLRFSPFFEGGWSHAVPDQTIEGTILAQGITFPVAEAR